MAQIFRDFLAWLSFHRTTQTKTESESTEALHYVFRTITTLLAMVQQRPQYTWDDHNDLVGKSGTYWETRRQELRLLNALAIVMVREHEIIAVVSKSYPIGGKYQLVVTGQTEAEVSASPLRYLANMNPRRGPNEPRLAEPSLNDPEVPMQFKGTLNNSQALIKYVEEPW